MRNPTFLASRASLALVAFALAAGCNNNGQRVTMQDDFDLDLFGPHTDDLHTPYVVGARFNIDVTATDGSNTAGWTLQSSDPTVFSIGTAPAQPGQSASSAFSEPVVAVAAGQATVTVLDNDGKTVDSHVVVVGIPDSVQLYAHGKLIAGESDVQALVSTAQVVSGGDATFLVRYFEAGTELSGSGALAPTATGAIAASAEQSTLATARDWLEVDGSAPGTGQVSLVVGGLPLSTLPVTVVGQSAIQTVTLLQQSTAQANDGATLWVVGRALDAQSNDVYGASYQWSFQGASLGSASPIFSNQPTVPTDLVSYTYQSNASGTVLASLGTLDASTVVHAQAGSVGVSSTADVACSVGAAPGAGLAGGASAAFGLAAIAAGAVRRRRVRA
jgi:hypothetical protein